MKNELHSGPGHLDGRLHRLRVLRSDRVHHRELHLAAGHQEQIRPQKLVSGGEMCQPSTDNDCVQAIL